MLPRLPLLGLPTYGLMVALGFVVALAVAGRTARRLGFARHAVEDVGVWAALAGLLGAKLLLVAVDPAAVLADPGQVLFQGGVFYGGFIAAVLTVLLLCWRRGLDPHAVGDACAPALALGHAFGRLGCFLAGCCWGRPCELPWGVEMSDPRAAAVQALAAWPGRELHPVQLYEAGANLALAGLLLVLLPRRRFSGQVWWTYVALYGAARLALEGFRGDPRGEAWPGGPSTSQAIAVGALALAAAVLAWRSRRAATPSPPERPAS